MLKQYKLLANAIILMAVKDYRETESQREKEEIIQFFRSDWFKALTNIDCEYLIKRLKSEGGTKK